MKDIFKKILLEIIVNAIIIICIYFLWNWLMPDLIMAKKITILQAWILRVLVSLCTFTFHERK
jgi:hypothetical protein